MSKSKFEEIKSKIRGPVFPILTPFNEDGSVDYDGLDKYVNFLIDNGAKNLMVTVGTSRFELLNHEEIMQVNKTVAEASKGRAITMVADPLVGSTQDSIDFANKASDFGADAIILYYNERHYGDDSVYKFFEDVANNTDSAIIIHEMAMRSGYGGMGPSTQYSIDLLGRLLKIDNIIGMKEECGEVGYAYNIIRRFSNDAAIICGRGGMRNYLTTSQYGSKSYLVGIGNFNPKIEIEFYDHIQSGRLDEAKDIVFNKEEAFLNYGARWGWHPCLKEALAIKGLMQPYERAPLHRVGKEISNKLAEIMKESSI